MKATADDIGEALRKRYPTDAYAVIFQVPNGTGSKKQRTADALVFGLWPSRGLDIEGIEIKVSRSDWRREIEDPAKASIFSRHCNRWWIAAPPGIVETGELPPNWGLLELKRGTLRQAIEAPRTAKPEPIPHSMWAAIMRAVQNRELRAVEMRRRELRDEARQEAERRIGGDYQALQKAVDEFRAATGVDVRFAYDAEAIGKALTLVRSGRNERTLLRQLSMMTRDLRAMADRIDEAAADEDL